MTTVSLHDMNKGGNVEYVLPEQEVQSFLQWVLGNSQWKFDENLIAERAMIFRRKALENLRPAPAPAAPLERTALDEKSYPELQELAAARGLRSVGVSHGALVDSLVGK